MNPDSISYTPLDAMNNAWLPTLKSVWRDRFWQLATAALIAAGGLAFVTHSSNVIIFAVVLYFFLFGSYVNRYKNKIWQQFALVNGWSVSADDAGEGLVPPSLQFGHSQNSSPVITANLAGLQCDLFEFDTTTGGGRYKTTHYFTVATAPLPKSMPHMVLRAKKSLDSDMQNDMDNGETLQLEGDFNDYFKLQVEKGQEIDVLAIITPDVMQTLVNYNQAEDLEILGSSLYFIMRDDKRDSEQIRQLIRSIIELTARLQENARLSGTAVPANAVDTPIVAPT